MTGPRWARAAMWWAAVLLGFVWWTPSIIAALAAVLASRARFWAVMALVDALAGVGRADLAGMVCAREAERRARRRRG